MKNVLQYLEESAKKNAEKKAICEGEKSVTYSEFMSVSRRIGSFIAEKYTMKDMPVLVYMDKGISALMSFFGVIYSGNFYAMANNGLPQDRLKSQVAVLESKVVITNTENLNQAREIYADIDIINVDEIIDSDYKVNDKLLDKIRESFVDVSPLYANFTSGSTGVPKAVLVNHRSVIDFIECFTEIFDINDTDIIANQAPFDFDVSVKDIYSAIKTGATLEIVPKELFNQPAKLIDLLCDKKVTTMIWAVSALCLITTCHGLDYKVPDTVKKVLFSGETMPIKHLNSWMEHMPETTFVNLYGPTEITCNCTYHIIDRNRDYNGIIPIGKAFPNEEILLINDKNELITEPDESGEILVRGTAVTMGYYNCPDITAKMFCQNPTNKYYPEIVYKTGDLGYYNDLGELVFNGRKDFQVKHMGHRIELEEVEMAINGVPGVERSIVVYYEEKSKLYGFYIGSIDKKELHKILREKLPVFMVPGILENVEEFPLTKNGKTDRRKLLQDKLDSKKTK